MLLSYASMPHAKQTNRPWEEHTLAFSSLQLNSTQTLPLKLTTGSEHRSRFNTQSGRQQTGAHDHVTRQLLIIIMSAICVSITAK